MFEWLLSWPGQEIIDLNVATLNKGNIEIYYFPIVCEPLRSCALAKYDPNWTYEQTNN